MTPQEMNIAANELGSKVLEVMGNHKFQGAQGMEEELKVTYLSLLQLIASFSKTLNLKTDSVLKDLKTVMERADAILAMAKDAGDDKAP